MKLIIMFFTLLSSVVNPCTKQAVYLQDIEQPIQTVKVENEEYIDEGFTSMQMEMNQIENIEDRLEWFIAYKNIVNKYSGIFDPPETIYDYYSEEEIYLMQKVIETECYEQDFVSKCNVASVIINRVEGDRVFGQTVEEVVTMKNQFAYGRENISESTRLALEYAFQIEDTTHGALFFHSNEKTETFCGYKYLFTDSAGHHFYG